MASTFALDVSRWVEKAKGRMDVVARKVALEAFRRVILKTPVKSGRARGNWQCAIGEIPDDVLELDDKTGTATISRATAESQNFKAGEVIYLVNNVPYINKLENGSSKQAPAGMVATTVLELGGIVKDATREP